MTAAASKDLIVLVADKNTEFSIRGLLSKRSSSLRIRPLLFDIFVHPQRDPGCLRLAHDFLRPYSTRYRHALVVLDRDGCGQEHRKKRTELEQQIEERLIQSGWAGRAAAVVIEPELEIWVWSQSPHVDVTLGWQGRSPGLREWLIESKLLDAHDVKPGDPKRAVEEALRVARKARSSNLYLELSSSVSFEGCKDEAFLKLRQTLAHWFGLR